MGTRHSDQFLPRLITTAEPSNTVQLARLLPEEMSMNNRHEVMDEGKVKLRTSVPKLLIHLFIAGLIWVFGQAIVSVAQPIFLFGLSLGPIISAVIVVALVFVLIRVAFELRDTADGLAAIAAVAATRSSSGEVHVENYRGGFRALVYILYGAVIYLFFYGFLVTINPALAGVALLLLVIWAVVLLFQVGTGFSKAIEDWSNRAVERAGDRLHVTDTGVSVSPLSSPGGAEERTGKSRKRK